MSLLSPALSVGRTPRGATQSPAAAAASSPSPLDSPSSSSASAAAGDLSSSLSPSSVRALERELEQQIDAQMKLDEQEAREREEKERDDAAKKVASLVVDTTSPAESALPSPSSAPRALHPSMLPVRAASIPEHAEGEEATSGAGARFREQLQLNELSFISPATHKMRPRKSPSSASSSSSFFSPAPDSAGMKRVKDLLLTSPHAEALRSCMRKVGAELPAVSPCEQKEAPTSPIAATTGAHDPSHSASKLQVIRRISLGTPGSASDPAPSDPPTDVASLQAQLSFQEQQIRQAGMMGEQLIAEIERLEAERKDTEEAHRSASQEKDEHIADLRRELDRALQRNSTLNAQHESWKNSLGAAEEQMDAYQAQLLKLQQQLTMFEASNASMKRALKQQKCAMQASTDEKDCADKEREEMRERIRFLEDKTRTLQQDNAALKEELVVAQHQHAELATSHHALERSGAALRSENEQLCSSLDQHRLALSEVEAQLREQQEQAQRAMSELKDTLEQKETQLEEQSNKIERLEAQVAKLSQLRSSASANDMGTTSAPSPPHPSTLSSALFSPPKGYNARLSQLKYSSLLSELESELSSRIREQQQDETRSTSAAGNDEPKPTPPVSSAAPSSLLPNSSVPSAIAAKNENNPPAASQGAKKPTSQDDEEGEVEEMTISSFLASAASSVSQRKRAPPVAAPNPAPRLAAAQKQPPAEPRAVTSARVSSHSPTLIEPAKAVSLPPALATNTATIDDPSLPLALLPAPSSDSAALLLQPPAIHPPTFISNDELSARELVSRNGRSTPARASSAPGDAAGSPGVLREYFHLATLAVKLGSLSASVRACNLPVHLLYAEVLERDVPFAHWHTWIEEKLEECARKEREEKEAAPARVTPVACTPIKPVAYLIATPVSKANISARLQSNQQQLSTPAPAPSALPATPQSALRPPSALSTPALSAYYTPRSSAAPAPSSSSLLMKENILGVPLSAATPQPQPRGAAAALAENINLVNTPARLPPPSTQKKQPQQLPSAPATPSAPFPSSSAALRSAFDAAASSLPLSASAAASRGLVAGPQVAHRRPVVHGADPARWSVRSAAPLPSTSAAIPAAAPASLPPPSLPPPATPSVASSFFNRLADFVTASPAPRARPSPVPAPAAARVR